MIKKLKKLAKRVLLAGGRRRCPVCRSRVRVFLPYGTPPRREAMCPVCGSLERHRLLWLYLERETGLLRPPVKRVLHFAPEESLAKKLRRSREVRYVSMDLFNAADVRGDITSLPFPDGRLDVIFCSHVLEHVPDDTQAMKELARIMNPAGWGIINVPVDSDVTVEDLEASPEERIRRFGQADHVRVYGRDYADRLKSAGFKVEVIPYWERLSEHELYTFGLKYERDDIYLCRRSL